MPSGRVSPPRLPSVEVGASGPSGSAPSRMPDVVPTVTPRVPSGSVRQPVAPSRSQEVGVAAGMPASPVHGWGHGDLVVAAEHQPTGGHDHGLAQILAGQPVDEHGEALDR